MDKLKSLMFSWKGAVIAAVVVLGLISSACGGSKGEKVVNKDGETVEINYYSPSAYIDAVNANDFGLAHKVLDKLYARYLQEYNEKNGVFWNDSDEKYWAGASHIYKAEMMWLLPQNDEEANTRMVYTLQSMNAIGEKPSVARQYRNHEYSKVECYVDFVNKYNALCSDILDISIANGNEDMANRIVKLFKENYARSDGKDAEDFTIHTYTPDRGEIEAAKAKLAEAKADGSFEQE